MNTNQEINGAPVVARGRRAKLLRMAWTASLMGCLAAGAALAGEFYPTGGDQGGDYGSGGNEKYGLLDVPGGEPELPVAFALRMCSPNPLRGPARFEFTLPRAADVSASVFDVQGREARRVAKHRHFASGTHQLEISMRGLASAPYWCRLTFRDHQTKQVFHEEVKKILRLE